MAVISGNNSNNVISGSEERCANLYFKHDSETRWTISSDGENLSFSGNGKINIKQLTFDLMKTGNWIISGKENLIFTGTGEAILDNLAVSNLRIKNHVDSCLLLFEDKTLKCKFSSGIVKTIIKDSR